MRSTRHCARSRRLGGAAGLGLALALVLAACTSPATAVKQGPSAAGTQTTGAGEAGTQTTTPSEAGIHKIKHVVIIMQENRSFDSYFGTYPGADGIPSRNGHFTVCVPDPRTGGCVKPYHDPSVINAGGPHGRADASVDVDGGKMDGFIKEAEDVSDRGCMGPVPLPRKCLQSSPTDVMGYHDAREIPNYWTYADDFTLQDHMFDPVSSWSLPTRMYNVSDWSAFCTSSNPLSCKDDPNVSGEYFRFPIKFHDCLVKHGVTYQQYFNASEEAQGAALACASTLTPAQRLKVFPTYAWTDVTYLLHKYHVSWANYVQRGVPGDCDDTPDEVSKGCKPHADGAGSPSIWNPLPSFTDIEQDHQAGNNKDLSAFYTAAARGKLPAVSWIIPSLPNSDHPSANIETGQAYVTNLINTIMKSPDWDSTAIFITWDEWGGFYDHVVPPDVGANGFGPRVPGLVISPYAKRDFIDHQVLSFSAYSKFIEDDFLNSARLDPKTDGRPDPRPEVLEDNPDTGNLVSDFNFGQQPRRPVLLPLHPKPGPASTP